MVNEQKEQLKQQQDQLSKQKEHKLEKSEFLAFQKECKMIMNQENIELKQINTAPSSSGYTRLQKFKSNVSQFK